MTNSAPTGGSDRRHRTLLVVISAALIVSAVAATLAGRGEVLGSNILFRAVVGAGVFLTLYVAIVVVAWAARGQTAQGVSLPGGGGIQGPESTTTEAAQVAEGLDELEAMTQRATASAEVIETLREQLTVSTSQLERLDSENRRLSRENAELRANAGLPASAAVLGDPEIRASRGGALGTGVEPD